MAAERVVYSADELRVGDRVSVSMCWRSQMISIEYPGAWDLTINGCMNAAGIVTKIEDRWFKRGGMLQVSNKWTVVHVDDGEHVWPIVDPDDSGDFSATIMPLKARTLRSGRRY